MLNKKVFLFFLLLLFIINIVTALPTTFKGNVYINNNSETNIPIKIVSDLIELKKEFNETYSVNVVGTENTTIYFYIYGIEIDKHNQPKQTTTTIKHLYFDDSMKLNDGYTCEYNQACKSDTCCFDSSASNYNECGTCEYPVVRRRSSGGGMTYYPISCNINCIVNWSCSNWTECINDTHSRNCEELNNCCLLENEPINNESCSINNEQSNNETNNNQYDNINETGNNLDNNTGSNNINPEFVINNSDVPKHINQTPINNDNTTTLLDTLSIWSFVIFAIILFVVIYGIKYLLNKPDKELDELNK